MDYIRQFDIKLEREVYYSGETVNGYVIMDTVQNVKVRGIRAVLRGKCAAEWKIMKSGQRSGVNERQYFIDDKITLWGNDKKDELSIPILEAGYHQFPFKFPLPDTTLPCSFESKAGKIRYYVKVTIDIPYASPPQGIKHFTVIGPTTDCSDEKFTIPIVAQDMKVTCCFCWKRGPISLRCTLNRSAYCGGEPIELRSEIDNQGNEAVALRVRLVQHVEYFIDSRTIGVTKYLTHNIVDYRSEEVPVSEKRMFDDNSRMVIPVTPPTLIGIAKNIQIYYVLKVCLESANKTEDLHLDFPLTIATVPLSNILDDTQRVVLAPASDNVEGGMYTSPEFQIGQVYDGTQNVPEDVVLYRPVYVKVLPASTGGTVKPHVSTQQDKLQANGSLHDPKTAATVASHADKSLDNNISKQRSSKDAVDNNIFTSSNAVSSFHGANNYDGNKANANPSRDSDKNSLLRHQKSQEQQATPPTKTKRHLDTQNSREQLLQPALVTSSTSKKQSLAQPPMLRRRKSSERKSSIDDDVDEDRDIRLALHDTSGLQPGALARESSTSYLEPTSAAALAATYAGNAMNGNNTLADSSADVKQHRHRHVRNNDEVGSDLRGGASSATSVTVTDSMQRAPLVASTSRSSASSAHKLRKQPSQDSGGGGSRHVSRL